MAKSINKTRGSREWGYTLLELLLVIAILAGASFLFLVRVPIAIESSRLNLASTQLLEEFREAKQAALTEDIWYEVKFYPTLNVYTINRQGIRLKTVKLPEGVRYANIPTNIIFSPEGTPNVGATILLGANNRYKKVIVAPVSGRIREE